MVNDSTHTERLFTRINSGDMSAVDELLESQRDYLRRFLDLRMEDELKVRVDPSDVVQETLFSVSRRLVDFAMQRPTTLKLWIRSTANERLIDARRAHFALKRSVQRTVTLSDASSMAIVRNFVGEPDIQRTDHEDFLLRVRRSIQQLSDVDREILILRHVEELKNGEVAELLKISPDAASKRYGRAVQHLSQLLRRFENGT